MTTIVLCARCGRPRKLTANFDAVLALGIVQAACAPRCEPPAHSDGYGAESDDPITT